jgi:hypothetical protein
MPNDSSQPRYRYSPCLLVPALRVVFGVRSSLSRDAAILLRGADPSPCVIGAENIPAETPFILVMNHYDHPALGAWWAGATIARTVALRRTAEPRELHLVMAREWWYPSGIGKWIKQPFTRWLFGQIAKTYGIATLPPVLEQYKGTGAIAVRKILALTRGEKPELVGLAPEGRTGENFGLTRPPAGTGLFLTLMSHDQIPFLPVGIFENDQQRLVIKFGTLFKIDVPKNLPREERDAEAARQVMAHIGALLPERMWGAYRAEICTLLRLR